MPGIIVKKNGVQLAAVSAEGLNLIVVNIQGDVIGNEISTMHVQGGLYGKGECDKHLLWVYDIENKPSDVIEIIFEENVITSHDGKTIEDIHPENNEHNEKDQSMEDLFDGLIQETPIRNGFRFNIICTESEFNCETKKGDFSFCFTAMWRWIKPNELRVSLNSNTLKNIKNREPGTGHWETKLQYNENVKFKANNI